MVCSGAVYSRWNTLDIYSILIYNLTRLKEVWQCDQLSHEIPKTSAHAQNRGDWIKCFHMLQVLPQFSQMLQSTAMKASKPCAYPCMSVPMDGLHSALPSFS